MTDTAPDADARLETERLEANICIRTGLHGEPCAQHYDHIGNCDWWSGAARDRAQAVYNAVEAARQIKEAGIPAAGRIIAWDWREQPDVPMIVDAALTISMTSGAVHVRMVDTGSDEYAVCISARPLDDAEIGRLYARFVAGQDAGDE